MQRRSTGSGTNRAASFSTDGWTNDRRRPIYPKNKITTRKYTIVAAKTIEALSKQVNALIAEGWRPQGGLTNDAHIVYFAQAMVRGEG
ncbi:MAG: hypothetical protein AAGN35_07430 [Bacteroidota bacterium]